MPFRITRRAFWVIAVACLLLVAALGVARSRGSERIAQVPFSDLLQQLDRGAVSEVVIDGDALNFRLTDGRAFRTVAPANYVTANAAFVPEMAKKKVRLEVRTSSDQAAYSYGALALGIAFMGLIGFTLYRVTSGRIPARARW